MKNNTCKVGVELQLFVRAARLKQVPKQVQGPLNSSYFVKKDGLYNKKKKHAKNMHL